MVFTQVAAPEALQIHHLGVIDEKVYLKMRTIRQQNNNKLGDRWS